jgi:hypothetical protein
MPGLTALAWVFDCRILRRAALPPPRRLFLRVFMLSAFPEICLNPPF